MITINEVKEIAKKEFPNRELVKIIDLPEMNFYELQFALQSPEDHHKEPTLPMSPIINKDTGELKWWDLLDDIEYEGKRVEIEVNKSKQRAS